MEAKQRIETAMKVASGIAAMSPTVNAMQSGFKAGQAALAQANMDAKQRVEASFAVAGAVSQAAVRSGPAPSSAVTTAPMQCMASTAQAGTYADTYASQGMSGMNDFLAGLAGAPVDAAQAFHNGLNVVGRWAGVPEERLTQYSRSIGGSENLKEKFCDWGVSAPPSADPTKQGLRNGVTLAMEAASIAAGAASLISRQLTSTGTTLDAVVANVYDQRLAVARFGVDRNTGALPQLIFMEAVFFRETTFSIRTPSACGVNVA